MDKGKDWFWAIIGYVLAAGVTVLIAEMILGLGVSIVCRIAELIGAL